MQIDGKNVDAIQWLRETGGKNAVKRFAVQQTETQAAQKQPADKVTLTKEAAAELKNQIQYAKAGAVPGVTAAAGNAIIAQLQEAARQKAPAPKAVAANTANSVQFNAGEKSNTVAVTGEGNIVRGYNGGQKNNTITVTGNTNRLYAGENVANSTISIKGGQNSVNLGTGASNNTVAVTGDNVKVLVGSSGLAAGSNQNWKISVAASNVEVSVVNGKATVNMADELQSKYKVTIDDAAKTVNVALA